MICLLLRLCIVAAVYWLCVVVWSAVQILGMGREFVYAVF